MKEFSGFKSFVVGSRLKQPAVSVKPEGAKETKKAASSALSGGITAGVAEASAKILPALNEAMAQSVWGWPNVTIRKNTSEVKAPRDIIDTTNLRDSCDITNTDRTITITYTAPYANITHYGGIIRPYGRTNGDTFVIPARPWISSMLTGSNGIEPFKVLDFVDSAVNKAWSNM